MQGEGIARETISISMLVAVLGGLAFQIPIGRLSDRFDRRVVLAALGVGLAGAAVALVLLPHSLQVAIESFEATMACLVLSSYFAGFTLAALRCGPIRAG